MTNDNRVGRPKTVAELAPDAPSAVAIAAAFERWPCVCEALDALVARGLEIEPPVLACSGCPWSAWATPSAASPATPTKGANDERLRPPGRRGAGRPDRGA